MKRILLLATAVIVSINGYCQNNMCFRKLLDNGVFVVTEPTSITLPEHPSLGVSIQHIIEDNKSANYLLLSLEPKEGLTIPDKAKLLIKTPDGSILELHNEVNDYPYDNQLYYWLINSLIINYSDAIQKEYLDWKKMSHLNTWSKSKWLYYRLNTSEALPIGGTGYFKLLKLVDAEPDKLSYSYLGSHEHYSRWGVYKISEKDLLKLSREGITKIRIQTSKENYEWEFTDKQAVSMSRILKEHLFTINENLHPEENFGQLLPKASPSPMTTDNPDSQTPVVLSVADVSGTWESEEYYNSDQDVSKSITTLSLLPDSDKDSNNGTYQIEETESYTITTDFATIKIKARNTCSGRYTYKQAYLLFKHDPSTIHVEMLENKCHIKRNLSEEEEEYIEEFKKLATIDNLEKEYRDILLKRDTKEYLTTITEDNKLLIFSVDPETKKEKNKKEYHRVNPK